MQQQTTKSTCFDILESHYREQWIQEYYLPFLQILKDKGLLDDQWGIHALSKNSSFSVEVLPLLTCDQRRRLNWFHISRNTSMIDIGRNPRLPWDWAGVSINPAVDVNVIDKYLEQGRQWDFGRMSSLPIASAVLVERFSTAPWNWSELSKNPTTITAGLLRALPDKSWHWPSISCNRALTLEILKEFPDQSWDWQGISGNPALTIEILKEFLDKPWEWDIISDNHALTIEILKEFPDKPWEWAVITMTIGGRSKAAELVRAFPHQAWWFHLSWSPFVTLELIKEFHDKPWNFRNLSQNASLTLEMLLALPDKPWEWVEIGQFGKLSVALLTVFADKPWDWRRISSNPSVNEDIVAAFIDRPWCWVTLSRNFELTLAMVTRFSDCPWDWVALCERGFARCRERFVASRICRVAFLSMVDEDYNRPEVAEIDGGLNGPRPADLIIQNEAIAAKIVQFI